jgi:hypothetical protein
MGVTSEWLMSNLGLASNLFIADTPAEHVATGDFNHDSTTDYLKRYNTSVA